MSRTPTDGIDYTNKDYEAFRTMMLKALQEKMPEYTDLRQTDAGIVILELNAMGLDILSYYQDSIANEVYLSTAEQMSSALKWCQMLGYTPSNATPSKFEQVFVLTSAQGTPTTIPVGTTLKTLEDIIENEVYFETEKDLIIPSGKIGNEVDLEGHYLYTVPVVEGRSIQEELVGSSLGTPNQKFILNYSPVIVDSVSLMINEGSGFEEWNRVDNFIDSLNSSKDFTLLLNDNNEAIITFGNGVFGKIPTTYTNGIYANYRIGGGVVGNLGAQKIVMLDSELGYVDSTFNPYLPFELGKDKESLEEIKTYAPTAQRTLWGALTEQDFADVVKMNFKEVVFTSAKVDTTNIDDIHIYVMLKDGLAMTEEFRKKILDLFDINKDGRKIVGSNVIYVEPPTLLPLTLTANLIVREDYSRSATEGIIREYLMSYFALGKYDFNTELSLSELASNITILDKGIRSFRFTEPSTDFVSPTIKEVIVLNSITLVTSGGVD